MRLLGLGERSIERRPIAEVLPQLGPVVEAALRDDRPEHRDQISVNRGGRERTINIRVTTEGSSDDVHGYVITLDDITDLVSAQRSSAWADVARRIAHEIKNPLTPIQLSAERLRRKFGKAIHDDRDIFDQCTDTIIRQVGDIGRMVDEFSSFARMPKPRLRGAQSFRSRSARRSSCSRSLTPTSPSRSKLPDEPLARPFRRAPDLPGVHQHRQERAPRRSPGCRRKSAPSAKITLSARIEDENIVVDVTDNGVGLPTENRHRLLEPYMTTREKGTGLGLAIVTKIIEEHGGRIELLDSPEVQRGGHGALIRVTLPAMPAKTAAPAPEVEDVH